MFLPLLAALTLETATGGTETLFPAKDRKATVVFVVISECPNARAYSPEMARLSRDYTKRGVRFVMAFADGDAAAMRTQMREFGLPFPAARSNARLVRLLKAAAVPTAAIVTADGTVPYVGRIDDRYPALGIRRPVRKRDLKIALDQFLAGKPVVPARTPVIGCALPNG